MRHLIAPLARTYRVYAPDLPGFGLSDRPDRQYSAALYSSLCHDFLRDVVKEPATLAASELSCNYAVSAAASAPDLCRALILISPYALEGNARPALPSNIAAVPFLKTLLYPLLSTRVGFLLTHDRKQREHTDFAQFYAQTHQLGAEHAVMALLTGQLVENVSPQFQGLQQPVLLIWGVQTNAISRPSRGAIPAEIEPRLRKITFIPEAGLAAHEEQPESVVAAIMCWQAETMPAFEQAGAHTRTPTASPPAALQAEKEPAVDQARPDAEKAALTPLEEGIDSRARSLPPVGGQKDGPLIYSTAQTGSALAYCVKCKQKREIQGAYEVTMKNGRTAVRGTCAVCGARLNRIGKLT
jgi:haloalkane dehalogenase